MIYVRFIPRKCFLSTFGKTSAEFGPAGVDFTLLRCKMQACSIFAACKLDRTRELEFETLIVLQMRFDNFSQKYFQCRVTFLVPPVVREIARRGTLMRKYSRWCLVNALFNLEWSQWINNLRFVYSPNSRSLFETEHQGQLTTIWEGCLCTSTSN